MRFNPKIFKSCHKDRVIQEKDKEIQDKEGEL